MKSTNQAWLAGALAVALIGGTTVVSAASLSLKPTDQSDVNEVAAIRDETYAPPDPTANFSTKSYSRAGYSETGAESPDDQGSAQIWTTYLKFKLPVPADAGAITGATLTLDLVFLGGKDPSLGINAKYVDNDDWSADVLNLETAPKSTPPEAFKAGVSTAEPMTMELDVTELLLQEGEGFGNELSIAVKGLSNLGGKSHAGSRMDAHWQGGRDRARARAGDHLHPQARRRACPG